MGVGHMKEFYAHTKVDEHGGPCPVNQWETLFSAFGDDLESECQGNHCSKCEQLAARHGHLNKVAWWSAYFAGQMFPEGLDRQAAHRWGYITGLWHDLGKFSEEFQEYLRSASGDSHEGEVRQRVDHSTAGAQHAVQVIKVLGHLIAYPIAGHHSGLLDGEVDGACQHRRLIHREIPRVLAPSPILEADEVKAPELLRRALSDSKCGGFRAAFFVRMLFSCLVDADFLATEAFMNVEQSGARNRVPADVLASMLTLLEERIAAFGTPESDDLVNRLRGVVVNDCRSASGLAPGLFTLTVPTGGGKTLSSLLFALKHAIHHGQRRIIYVVPFTSIIEQNAEVFREIFEPLATTMFTPVIEHHSSLAPEKESTRSRLATENWDAPLILTTAVQFYQSLCASKTSVARKLHHIANSVVVLDEAQALPVNLLEPCLRFLEELAESYRTSVVLCTATQPAIQFERNNFPIGLKQTREIVTEPSGLYSGLKRVEVTQRGKIADEELVRELRSQDQVLCIVNRRQHAQTLFRLLGEGSEHFHLSALMCPVHRSEVLAQIRKRLAEGLPTRLISTQLIEAGVDIDFPVVYRALAGLDSIAQAAGRCNRNGRLNGLGRTFVFKPEDEASEAYFRETAQVAHEVLELHEDILGEEAIRHYFSLYYYQKKHRWDEKGILDHFQLNPGDAEFPFRFNFATADREFQLIENWQEPVFIPFDEKARGLIGQLRNNEVPLHRDLFRGLQRYSVQISPRLRDQNRSAFEALRDDGFYALVSPELNYSPDLGLILDQNDTNGRLLVI